MVNRDVIIIGENNFPFHRISNKGPILNTILSDAGYNTTVTTDKSALRGEQLARYDVILDFLTDSRFSDRTWNDFHSFVTDGGGYIGLHCAADLTLTTDGHVSEPLSPMRDLIGGHFVSHPDTSHIEIKIVDKNHPITADLSDFKIWDEPYRLEYDDDIRVLMRMNHSEVGDMPVAWVREIQNGRLFYCSLGHSNIAYEHPEFRTLIQNAVGWVTSEE